MHSIQIMCTDSSINPVLHEFREMKAFVVVENFLRWKHEKRLLFLFNGLKLKSRKHLGEILKDIIVRADL